MDSQNTASYYLPRHENINLSSSTLSILPLDNLYILFSLPRKGGGRGIENLLQRQRDLCAENITVATYGCIYISSLLFYITSVLNFLREGEGRWSFLLGETRGERDKGISHGITILAKEAGEFIKKSGKKYILPVDFWTWLDFASNVWYMFFFDIKISRTHTSRRRESGPKMIDIMVLFRHNSTNFVRIFMHIIILRMRKKVLNDSRYIYCKYIKSCVCGCIYGI